MRNTRRTNFIMIALAAVLCLMTALALSGCETEEKTLEGYLEDSPSAQEEIEESLSGLNNSDMDVAVTYHDNQVIITCDMKTTYKKKVLKTIKKSYEDYMEKNLTEPMEKAIANIEQETKISGVTIKAIVNNGDGTEIWSQVYPLAAQEETSGEDQSTEGGSDDGAKDGSASDEGGENKNE